MNHPQDNPPGRRRGPGESLPILGTSASNRVEWSHVDAAVERTSRHCSFVRASDRKWLRLCPDFYGEEATASPNVDSPLPQVRFLSRGDRGLSAVCGVRVRICLPQCCM